MWLDNFYKGAMETFPPDVPLWMGEKVDLWILVGSDDAGGEQTERFMTRFMIYMNISLINCYSTKQSTLETSVFGAKFGPIKVRVET